MGDWLVTTVLLDTDDVGEAEAALRTHYAEIRLSGVPSEVGLSARIEHTDLGAVGVQRLEYGHGFDYEIDPLDDLLICLVHSGLYVQRPPMSGTPDVARPGDVVAIGVDEGVPFTGRVGDGRYSMLVLDRYWLNEVVASAPGDSSGTVRLTGALPVSREANNHLAGVLTYVRDHVAREPFASDSPLLTKALARYVAASVLAAYPHTGLTEPTATDRRDSTPALLRRAMLYIEEHAAQDVSLTELAEAVYVTPRALQYMFRKHRDCTPTEYLRRIRLDHAHRELLAADRATTSVSDVARRWGFLHAGRFAVYYRECYGQSPHVTLRG